MYHDSIHIIFKSNNSRNSSDINFEYRFLISTNTVDLFHNGQKVFKPIKYQDLLDRFENLGFNIKFLNFPDIKDKIEEVYCTYNANDFEIFFKAYDKILRNKDFHISFEYGSLINGTFVPNNMNGAASLNFAPVTSFSYFPCIDTIIKGKTFYKTLELFQIVDKTGKIIHSQEVEPDTEHNFWENYAVMVYLRKYKLRELKENIDAGE